MLKIKANTHKMHFIQYERPHVVTKIIWTIFLISNILHSVENDLNRLSSIWRRQLGWPRTLPYWTWTLGKMLVCVFMSLYCLCSKESGNTQVMYYLSHLAPLSHSAPNYANLFLTVDCDVSAIWKFWILSCRILRKFCFK